MTDITILKRRRGVSKASITKLVTKTSELEAAELNHTTISRAEQLLKKLESYDTEFRTHHMVIVDSLDAEEDALTEQTELDRHDDEVTELSIRLQALTSRHKTSVDDQPRTFAQRHLVQLQARLIGLQEDTNRLTTDPNDLPLVHLYQEQLMEMKRELSDARNNILSFTVDDSDPLNVTIKRQDKLIFDMSVTVKRLLYRPSVTPEVTPPTTPETRGVNLPKIEIAMFNGDLLSWQTFWEQFDVSIHGRKDLTNAEKLTYLRHSLKDSAAKSVIEGQGMTDQGSFIKHMFKKICEAPNLKDDSGLELRRLHDTIQQHLRALKAMGRDPSGPFITSLIELKLDATTMFEWQKVSQTSKDTPHYDDILAFLNMRAQAAESCSSQEKRNTRTDYRKVATTQKVHAHVGATSESRTTTCVVCKTDKHPLYICSKFKGLSHDKMLSVIRSNNLCLNCLRSGHISRNCTSIHHCRKCQKPHHTLLHLDSNSLFVAEQAQEIKEPSTKQETKVEHSCTASIVSTNAQTGSNSTTLLMTCQVLVHTPNGSQFRVRGLLDPGSSTSFISQRLVQSLGLKKVSKNLEITGIAGMSHSSPLHSISTFEISPTFSPDNRSPLTAIVLPRVTCDLPVRLAPLDAEWKHLCDLNLSDPEFGQPGKIDLLFGVEVYNDVLLQGRRKASAGIVAPMAFETKFGWVLAGKTHDSIDPLNIVAVNHCSVTSNDDILRKFWEIEEVSKGESNLSPQEHVVLTHFKKNHSRNSDGRFIIPLPKDPNAKQIGESRHQAVRRFLSLERSLNSKGEFDQFSDVMKEYVDMGHAEVVPENDLEKPYNKVFYLPMHAVHKEHSTTTKIRAVFDASAKSSTGVSLNDTLMVGPTVHPSLIEVLLRFRLHRIALTADISKMYRAVELTPPDRDLHRFVWRNKRSEALTDYRMTRVTFGVSASAFAANMSVKQNALDYAHEYPKAANVVNTSFYVDDCLTGADSVEEALELQQQLYHLFNKGGFLLRKWNSSDASVLEKIPNDLKDNHPKQLLPCPEAEYTKTLGIEWNAVKDYFRVTVAHPPTLDTLSKRGLVSDIAKTFDILGWFSPATIKAKILLQRVWEEKIGWDDSVPVYIKEIWSRWRAQLPKLSQKIIPRCYFDSQTLQKINLIQLHGFSDASELAYAAVVYLRITDSSGRHQTSLVVSKTRVAPIKHLTIPRLELCGAYLLAQLLHQVKTILKVPLSNIYAWTDSTVVLNWLDENPKRFKTYVGNRISNILGLMPSKKWRHVNGKENPADCASRGLYPSELFDHPLWWNGPNWLTQDSNYWPKQEKLIPNKVKDEEVKISLFTTCEPRLPVIPVDRFSSFNHLKRVTCWIQRFVKNCKAKGINDRILTLLSSNEMQIAEHYWISIIQNDHFSAEISPLKNKKPLSKSSSLIPLNPFLDECHLLRVGGRQQLANTPYQSKHPLIIHGKHKLTHLLINSEHIRLLHAGPTLLAASLNRHYHIVGGFKTIRSITRKCITCRKVVIKPLTQLLGQLPIERVTPGSVFESVGIDYAGPLSIKYGYVRKPTIVKAYLCIFVSLSVKAIHLELVSDLTTEAFIACLRRFIARSGIPSLIWSDNGTNFVGAQRQLKELYEFIQSQRTQDAVTDFCTLQRIEWRFIPQRAPHFGGLWEAAVKSVKSHLTKVLGDVKLTYEEMFTILTEIESSLNSRPLAPLHVDDDGIEALTPGHFLIGHPLKALPDKCSTDRNISLLKRWQLCQALLRHFWRRWSREYVTTLNKFTKWQTPTRNMQPGDLVVIKESSPLINEWPLARVIKTHPGQDGLVRVATIKTSTGIYKRPIHKLALLLSKDEQ